MTTERKIYLPETDEALLAECEVETFRASGSGGQHVNVTDSAVRLRHLPSGLVVTSQQERSQLANKQICIAKLREKVAKLNYRPPKRIPTRKPKSAKEEILKGKARKSKKKTLRQKPHYED
jgi:peptide chain release factor 2